MFKLRFVLACAALLGAGAFATVSSCGGSSGAKSESACHNVCKCYPEYFSTTTVEGCEARCDADVASSSTSVTSGSGEVVRDCLAHASTCNSVNVCLGGSTSN